SPVVAQHGRGGDFDHLYLHNINDEAAVAFAARNADVKQYDKTVLENSHIMVTNRGEEDAAGSDGVQGGWGCSVRYSVLEGQPVASGWGNQHQDLIQSQASWFSAYGNVFKDGADSAYDFDCYNDDHPDHVRIFNNVFIKARGGDVVRFYGGG